MTTYQNLLPGTLIEYKKGPDGPETAWVLFIAGPAHTAGMIEIRVKGETGINRDLDFPIYVKARGRAKIVEKPKIAPTEKFVPPTHDAGPYRDPSTGKPIPAEFVNDPAFRAMLAPARVMTSHATCDHEKTKAARAACRKARAAAN